MSPAIVIPITLSHQAQGYARDNGIHTIVVASSSMDVVISLSLYGIFLGLAFSEGKGGRLVYIFNSKLLDKLGALILVTLYWSVNYWVHQ